MISSGDNELELVAEAVRECIAFRRAGPDRFDEFTDKMRVLGDRWRDLLHDEEIRGLLETFTDIVPSPGKRLVRAWELALEDLEDAGMEISTGEGLAALTHLIITFPSDDWKWEAIFEALRVAHGGQGDGMDDE